MKIRYSDSNHFEEFIGMVEREEVNQYEIRLQEHDYVFQLNDDEPIKIETEQ